MNEFNAHVLRVNITAQKMKFYIKNFFSKCDQIPRKPRIWSHLLRKSLMKNFIFVQCINNSLGAYDEVKGVAFYWF